MVKKVGLLLFLFTLVFSAGCKKEEQEQKAKPTAVRKYRFAIIPKALSIPVFNYAKIGAERMAQKLGDVEIIWRAPDIPDQLKQKEILESFIAQRVDGIAISCLNGDFLTPTINKAVDSGIPVITWDSDAPNSKRLAFYGVNDFRSGEIMGEELVKLLNGKGNIIILSTLGADNLEQRLAGAKSVLQKYPEIKIVEEFDCKDDFLVAKQIIEAAVKKYPDLNGFLSTGGWPVFNENFLDPVDTTKIKVVCFDTIPPAPKVMKAGKVHLMVGQKYFGWGSQSTKILYDIVTKNQYPEPPIVDSGVDIVTPQNVDAYIEKWNKMEKGEILE